MGGEVSTQGDVYNYGIFVLKLDVTGKRSTDKMFKDGFNLHNFVNIALPRKLMQIVDSNLLKREVNELTVPTKEEGYNYNDHDDIEEIEEMVHIENRSLMNSNMQKCLLLLRSKRLPKDLPPYLNSQVTLVNSIFFFSNIVFRAKVVLFLVS
jgi:hypothetical protein